MSRRGERSLPRPYQDKAVREVLTRYTDGACAQDAAASAHGGGRDDRRHIVFERLLPLIDAGKVLFIAHRRCPPGKCEA